MIKTLLKSKTAWTAFIGILTALGAYSTGDLPLPETIQSVFAGLSLLFLRHGIAKK